MVEADLGTSRSVGDIQVWNRLKSRRERLRDFYVFVSLNLSNQAYPRQLLNRSKSLFP